MNTTFEERIFDRALLDSYEINHVEAEENMPIAVTGTLKQLLYDLIAATDTDKLIELTNEEKAFLDYDAGNSDHILSDKFKQRLNKIPTDNEGEWIAECHNKLSQLFRSFETWEANSVVSAVIDAGLKPDRIFGFDFLDPNNRKHKNLRRVFPSWSTTGIRWPFLLIESRSQTYANNDKLGDTFKMAIIEDLAYQHQLRILELFKLPEKDYKVWVHVPITFGVYYTGSSVNISVYCVLDNEKYFFTFPSLDLKEEPEHVLKVLYIMKRYTDLAHRTVVEALQSNHWKKITKATPVNDENEEADVSESNRDNSTGTPKETLQKKPAPSTSKSNTLSNALSLSLDNNVQVLYKNHRTRVDLVTIDQQHQYIVKTTRTDLGKREYVVLEHLRALSCVPKVLDKPLLRGENITLTMSYCRGVHPLNFTSQSELQIFMKALLTALDQVHQHNIVHNDIKESNILWDNVTKSVYLIDFGCATTIGGETQAHTPGYCAPDLLKTPASDVYSAGIVLANLMCGVVIRSMQQANELALCDDVVQALQWKAKHRETSYVEATLCSEVSLDLARKMIVRDAKSRISIESALKHPFFDSAVPVSPSKRVKTCQS